MLALAIVLTIVSAVMLLTGLALGLYVVWVKVREFHQSNGAKASGAEGPGAS